MGPRPRPITNDDRPRVAMRLEQLNSLVIWVYVEVYMEEVSVLQFALIVSQELRVNG